MTSGRTYVLLTLFAAFAFLMVALARFTSPPPSELSPVVAEGPGIAPRRQLARSGQPSTDERNDERPSTPAAVDVIPTELPDLSEEEAEKLKAELELEEATGFGSPGGESPSASDTSPAFGVLKGVEGDDQTGAPFIDGPTNLTSTGDVRGDRGVSNRPPSSADGGDAAGLTEPPPSAPPGRGTAWVPGSESQATVPPSDSIRNPVVPTVERPSQSHESARPPLSDRSPELTAPVVTSPPTTPELNGLPEAEIPDGHSLVLHGAGALKVVVPDDWRVAEVPHGREVRLVLTPSDVAPGSEQLRLGPLVDGVWFVCHVRSETSGDSTERLETLLPDLADRALEGRPLRSTPPRGIRLGGAPGVAIDLATRPEDSPAVIAGRLVLVATPWGFCEIHLAAPIDRIQERLIGFNRLMNSVRFGPLPEDTPTTDTTDAAEPILGTWKAYKSMLRLRGDGTIVIVNDRPADLSMEVVDGGSVEGRLPDDQLTGKFEARDDLLLVRWDDGSLLNFRWRIRDENLLLTDHQGRTSLLRKIAR